MTTKFKYRLDRRARITTWAVLGAVALCIGALWFFSLGGYLPAWLSSIAVAGVALCSLSIPRSIRVTDEAVEIRCLVEITHITYQHIRSVERIGRPELKLLPVFASMGVFGYFGYYLDVRNWDIVKVYASSRRGLVMIEDIYEQRYIVNADEPDRLMAAIARARE